MTDRAMRTVGTAGLVLFVVLIALNLGHGFEGSTELYGDAVLFISKMGTWWVIDHIGLAICFLFVPWVAWAWVQTFEGELAQLWGRLAWMTVLIGSLPGVVHLGEMMG